MMKTRGAADRTVRVFLVTITHEHFGYLEKKKEPQCFVIF